MRGLRSLVADAQAEVNMFRVKVHRSGGDVLVACCDAEILGARLSDGDFEYHVNERFYGGDAVDADGLLEAVRSATVANLIGDRVVGLAIERGLVGEDGVAEVCGVKHAQVYVV
jgi:uncharacterized protein